MSWAPSWANNPPLLKDEPPSSLPVTVNGVARRRVAPILPSLSPAGVRSGGREVCLARGHPWAQRKVRVDGIVHPPPAGCGGGAEFDRVPTRALALDVIGGALKP